MCLESAVFWEKEKTFGKERVARGKDSNLIFEGYITYHRLPFKSAPSWAHHFRGKGKTLGLTSRAAHGSITLQRVVARNYLLL